MPTDMKISQLASGNPAQAGDLIPVDRSGANFSLTAGSVAALASDASLVTSDIVTNNVSTSKHGFAPKAPNDATKFLDGTGNYSTPPTGSVAPAFKWFSVWRGNFASSPYFFTINSKGSSNGSDNPGVWTTPTGVSLTAPGNPDPLFGFFGVQAAVTNASGQLQTGGSGLFEVGLPGKFVAIIRPKTNLNAYRFWVGVFNQLSNAATQAPAAFAGVSNAQAMMFFYDSSVDSHFQSFACDGGQFTLTPSTVTPVLNSTYALEIDWDGAGNVTYKINNVVVATMTASSHTPTSLSSFELSLCFAIGGNGVSPTSGAIQGGFLYGENYYSY